MGRIFISYSHKNSEIASFINDYLTKNHILTWFDHKSIEPGSRWETNITTVIPSCNTFLVFHSHDYTTSKFCRKEWELIVDRNRTVAPTILVVGLDDSKDSLVFDDITRYQFVDFNYRSEDGETLGERLVATKAVQHCRIAPDDIPALTNSTSFFDALQSMHSPKHYEAIETLIRLALLLKEEENNGRYISRYANFDELSVSQLIDGSLKIVPLSNAYCTEQDIETRNIFFRNIFFAMFKFSSAYRFTTTPHDTLEFGLPYISTTHRFAKRTMENAENVRTQYDVDAEIYDIFNKGIDQIYKDFTEPDLLAEKFTDILNASKFYENLETRYDGNRSIDYECTPLVLKVARKLFMVQNPPRMALSDNCIPKLCDGNKNVFCHDVFEQSDAHLYLHGNDGGGQTGILLNLFSAYPHSLYIDLGCGLYFGVREVLRGALSGTDPSCYKLDFAGLFKYSLYGGKRVTLLIDGIDMLSEKNRDRILAEFYELRDVFRIVIVSTKMDLENKLSLTVSNNLLDEFCRYEICPPEKQQIVEYIGISLKKLKTPNAEYIVKEFEKLDATDSLFTFFNNFTKLDILLGTISDWNSFSIEELHDEFNDRIKVYKSIFESHGEYSMKRKIASYFRGLVVDIEDIILQIVDNEVESIKKMAYNNTSLPNPVPEASELRFRNYYPVLSQILGNYFFVNEDIRNYFAASYIYSVVCSQLLPEDLEKLLAPVENNYGVLEYLHEFDIINELGDPELFLEEYAAHKKLILILYKIIQYYDGEISREFLRNVSFDKIPDKFFFRADNIEHVAVPPCVKEIGRAAFANMPRLKQIDFAPLGNGAPLSIRPWAIINCPALERIRLGNNYTQYRHPLFGRCYALRHIEISPANIAFSTLLDGQILASKDGETIYCATNSLEGELHIPEGVKILGNNSLSYLTKVTRIVLPSSLIKADSNFTDFCDVLTRIDVDKNNPVYYSDEDGLLYTEQDNNKVLFRVPSGKEGELKICNDVTIIGSDSISCCTRLDKIYVPASVHNIENYAFADTYGLQEIVFEDIDSVTTFGNYIFLSTNQSVKIFGDAEYSLAEFHATYSKPKNDDRLKGIVRQPVKSDLFTEHGFELLRAGQLKQNYSTAVLVRDITLFNNKTYREKDFNILLIGLTEYNAILTRDKQEADKYVENLIDKFHISAVVLSRDLPLVSQFESEEKYAHLLIARNEGGSTAVTKKIAAIIAQLGEKYD